MSRSRPFKAALLPGRGPLARVSPPLAFLLVAGLFAAGVLIRGTVGAGLLLLLAAGVGFLLAGTWGALNPGQRLGRVLIVGLLVGIALSVL